MTEPKIPAAVNVDWWFGEKILDGEPEFKAELRESYAVSVVRGRKLFRNYESAQFDFQVPKLECSS